MNNGVVRVLAWRPALPLLLGLFTLSGCASATSDAGTQAEPGTASETATTWTSGPPYLDTPEACMSRLPPGTTLSGGLAASDQVLAGLTCRESNGAGATVVVRDVTGDALAEVLTALRHPSQPSTALCDASARVLPTFALQLADGHWIHPEVPTDGCHPTDAVVRVLNSAAK